MDTNDKRSFFEKQYLRLYKKLYYSALAVLCSEADAGEAVREGVLATYAVYSGNCTTKEFDVRIFSALAETAEKFRRNKGFSRDEEVVKANTPQLLVELEKISHKERLCLALRGIAGLSAADIVDITGMQPHKVKADISMGRDRLKNIGLKGFRRGVLIKGQEEMFPIPEKLRPENIGDMLDNGSMAITSAAIDAANKEQRTFRKRSDLPKIAAAAAVVIAVGGMGFMLRGGISLPKTKKAEKVISHAEDERDDIDFAGLRRGSYKSLHTYLIESHDKNWEYSSYISDTRYISSNDYSEEQVFSDLSRFYVNSYIYGDIKLLTDSDPAEADSREKSKLKTFLQEDDKVFKAGFTSINTCKLEKGNAVFSKNDLMDSTYIRQELAENQVFKENGTKYGPYIVGMKLHGNYLIAAYNFHMPEIVDDKNIYQEYCGVCVFDKNSEELLYEYEQPGIMGKLCVDDNGRITVISQYNMGKKAAEAEAYNSGRPAFLPDVYENGEASLISEDDIYISSFAESSKLTVMSSIDISGDMMCTDKMVMTAELFGMVENSSDMILKPSCDDSEVDSGQLMRIDYSAGLEVKAVGNIPSDTGLSFGIISDYTSYYINNGSNELIIENGILYIVNGSGVMFFDEELNYLGEYVRSVFLDELPDDVEPWGVDWHTAVVEGSTVYFADIIEDLDRDDEDVLILESVDLSDINSPKAISYKEDTLSAPASWAGYGYNGAVEDGRLLHMLVSGESEDNMNCAIQLVSLRPEDVAEGKAGRRVYDMKQNGEAVIPSFDDVKYAEELPLHKPGVISQLKDLPFDNDYSSFYQINGKYMCMAIESMVNCDAKEISEDEYMDLLNVDETGEFDKVEVKYDDNDEPKYYYYNSITSSLSYILIEVQGDELKQIYTTPTETVELEGFYAHPSEDTEGFAVYDNYLYIFDSKNSAVGYNIAGEKK
ncbi:sigma-70 family RNA polymerase sigma factor [Ruminococcus albus]|uniref:DNA-directed RNA polymerase specialized sigma subunit, sigma24 family n=1 Tax=Ruminococcus albus TaxID=1264 RepID=A0A1H7HZM9_RUMAL|nr:sigma-70 family RNA polymerase sigma factor [Ruminococcus albus]SEK55077.1 DNA-directed RNA polymerase specialized sigma subunit, sigma24 family [Ruminococcus albus]